MFNGEITELNQIHHKDGNNLNNKIENLESVDTLRHAMLRHHMKKNIVYNSRFKMWQIKKRHDKMIYKFRSNTKAGVSRILNNFIKACVNNESIEKYSKFITSKNPCRSPFIASKENLLGLFRYEDGQLYNIKTGKCVGGYHHTGYMITTIKYNPFLIHRLIYIINHGDIPNNYVIDHMDGDKLNNRIENLRAVTPSVNAANRKNSKILRVVNNGKKLRIDKSLNGVKYRKLFNIDQKLEAERFRDLVIEASEDRATLDQLFL